MRLDLRSAASAALGRCTDSAKLKTIPYADSQLTSEAIHCHQPIAPQSIKHGLTYSWRDSTVTTRDRLMEIIRDMLHMNLSPCDLRSLFRWNRPSRLSIQGLHRPENSALSSRVDFSSASTVANKNA